MRTRVVLLQEEAGDLKSQLGAREQEVRELEGDITQAVADVRDALHREVEALAQADEERTVGRSVTAPKIRFSRILNPVAV